LIGRFSKNVEHFSCDVEPSDPEEKENVGHSGRDKMNGGISAATISAAAGP